eukprot:gnl/MRDRNA2_/MRDRNA2_27436_c0_seq1.p1 gnl/MRDRNA2_/MRDRNA2_27436_c0~~gnl/MRDRNA2_/MRDRNA2_27436_c0_seq1.p1  ORF type:complete len:391 (+),score=60.38 gnl/MRDRNA2_/MRDRNA2_27436_c0_seq1:74-1246(+)
MLRQQMHTAIPQFAAKQRLSKSDVPPEFRDSESSPAVEDGVAFNLQNDLLLKAPFTRLCIHSDIYKRGSKDKVCYRPKPQTPRLNDDYKPRAAAKAMGSLAGAGFRAIYRTKNFTTKGLRFSNLEEANDENGDVDFENTRPATSDSTEAISPRSRRRSVPANLKLAEPDSRMHGKSAAPPKEFVKSIHGHYCVPVAKSQWLGLLTFLYDETLLHPHALVYCDESVVSKQVFEQTMHQHNLIVADYGADPLLPQAIQDDGKKLNQFLVTNPKFSSMVSKPSISCIFHMGGVESPLDYGAHLLPVDEEVGWDAISVIFMEQKDLNKKTEIEKTYGIQFKEVPFDLPEISMHADKKEWSSAHIGTNWWSKAKAAQTVTRFRRLSLQSSRLPTY